MSDICPNCEGTRITCFMDVDRFIYGVDENARNLYALVPVFECGDCGECWTNWIGERNREETVAIHLGNDVMAVRAMYHEPIEPEMF